MTTLSKGSGSALANSNTDPVNVERTPRRERRAEAQGRARARGRDVQLHWLNPPLDVVIARARTRIARLPATVHRLIEDDVRHFATIFEPPTADEGIPLTRYA